MQGLSKRPFSSSYVTFGACCRKPGICSDGMCVVGWTVSRQILHCLGRQCLRRCRDVPALGSSGEEVRACAPAEVPVEVPEGMEEPAIEERSSELGSAPASCGTPSGQCQAGAVRACGPSEESILPTEKCVLELNK